MAAIEIHDVFKECGLGGSGREKSEPRRHEDMRMQSLSHQGRVFDPNPLTTVLAISLLS